MTTDKARKRAVRTRMHKTGERYAAAHRHVAPRRPALEPDAAPPVADAMGPSSAAPAAEATPLVPPGDPGWTDATIVKGTGRDWAHWLALLDDWGAMERTHTEIARWLVSTQDIPGWWAQTVTVGYERARGRRALHQTTRGFEVSVSKTTRAPLAVVWAALSDPDRRAAWVAPGDLEPTTARDGVVARFAVVGTAAIAEVVLEAKAADRTTVTASVRKLADGDDVERQRAIWRDRLRRLDAAVTAESSVATDDARSS
jgi:hypothetical protein